MVRWRWPSDAVPFRSKAAGPFSNELLLPEVEEGGRELMLVAEIRDGDVVDQVPLQDGDLLDGRIVLPRLSHGEAPVEL
jgi:hypothetical protein